MTSGECFFSMRFLPAMVLTFLLLMFFFYYLEGQSYGNWGIFNMMKARKETLSVRVMEETEGNM